jgi:hypothetical protein
MGASKAGGVAQAAGSAVRSSSSGLGESRGPRSRRSELLPWSRRAGSEVRGQGAVDEGDREGRPGAGQFVFAQKTSSF